ncbi:MAG TPA: MurR/RpiR family transcriptional regulator [Kaistiaceae bacterium]|nr:MurR/RpiR family transcriptional regulator [Kaistiaceae bacterium]
MTGTLDSPSIAERVRASMARFTTTERKAAHVLLAAYPVAGLETVAEFARRADVSAPTILRFVGRLGFASYPDFQKQLRTELDAQSKTPLAKTPERSSAMRDGGAFLNTFAAAVLDNISTTFANLPAAEFEAVVGLLAATRRRVFVVGGRFTDALAQYLSAHLRIVRPGVVHFDGQADNWRDQLLDVNRKDILLVFDIRRYQESLFSLAAKAEARGATVVLVTDQWLSPIARHAAHVLAARIAVPSNWDSSAAMLGLVEALVAATTDRLWDSASDRIAAVEELRRDG